MTANRNFDDIARAWLDLMPDEAPDRVVDSVLLAVDATPQVRRWLVGRWRLNKMSRIALASAASIVIAAGLFLVAPRTAGPGAVPTLPPPSSVASPSPVGSSTPIAADVALRTTWIAETEPIPALSAPGPSLAFIVNSDGNGAWIRASDGALSALRSTANASGTNVLQLSLDRAAGECASGDLGTYRWSISADGLVLSLTPVADACPIRQQALERRWVRSHMGSGGGGRAAIDAFDPAFLVTLPSASWQAIRHTDVVEVQAPDLIVHAGKDPQGFSDPCSVGGGKQKAIAPGHAPFEAYIRSIPTFTVKATDEVVGGHPARHFQITSTPTAACPKGTRIVEWRAKAEPGTLNWILSSGDPDTMDVVALPNATILLQLIPQGGATVDIRAILDSIEFVDTLSTVGSPAP